MIVKFSTKGDAWLRSSGWQRRRTAPAVALPPLPSPPLPLFERLVAQANGFQVVDRGDGDEDL